ncbi:dihydrofolate reductase family protein [Isoptericola aurantiacus]|uniref:dihydrofolate reductase family protein n=1 Tax=Isoptericola aurantiacus TaxID=3377839 RepID=UPI00383B2803
MGTLRFGMTCSLDGRVTDAAGNIGWSAPSDEMHAFVNGRFRAARTLVMGRRMYATLRVWDDWPAGSAVEEEFAGLWAATDKIVCSDSLGSVSAPRTTLEPRLTVDRLAQIVAATDGVVEVSGPTTAADALREGLVDEIDLFVLPQVLGGGLHALPEGMHTALALVDSRRFADGAVYLGYRRA